MFRLLPSIIKRFPTFFMLISLFTSFILLLFTLLGCTKSGTSYSGVYLIEYGFNSSSSMFPLIESAYQSTNNSQLVDMRIRIGYIGMCIFYPESDSGDEEVYCVNSDSKSLEELEVKFPGVSLYSSSSNSTTATLNLVELAHDFSDDVINPYLSMGVIALNAGMVLLHIYITMTFLPMRHIIIKINFLIGLVLCIMMAGAAIWADVAVGSSVQLMQLSSLSIIQAISGSRLKSMNWACFSLFLIYVMGAIFLYFTEFRKLKGKNIKNIEKSDIQYTFQQRRENL